MSIDKQSSGFPEINVHRRTTKVNLWMVATVLVFLAFAAAGAFWMAHEAGKPGGGPPPPPSTDSAR